MKTLPEPDDNARVVPFDVPGVNAVTVRRDFVKAVPEGACVAMVFRVVSYGADCDGSALARLEQVDRHGEATGLEIGPCSLSADVDVVLDGPDELHRLADGS